MSPPGIEVPPALAASYARSLGDEGRSWTAALPGLVADLLDRWDLRPDGATSAGAASLVVPVAGRDGVRAVLRLQPPRPETAAALTGLRAWDGHGTVRLLDHDPGSGTMLLERLDGARTLASVPDDGAATRVLAELHARLLAVPPPPGLPHLRDVAAAMLDQVPRAVTALADPAERRVLRDWAAVVAELAADPGDRMLHWDLHHDNVLAAEREPWLAIDPEPLVGDPGFDLWPALDSRWDDVVAGGDARRVVRRRFDVLTDVLDLDRERAAGWTLGRLLQNALWDIEDGEPALAPAALVTAEALRGGQRGSRPSLRS
ncbi:aminoglycoside phosphotransferase family protein [Promicromonospora sukumoe]|uniref:aminoglycoside phosphotransferase family protein n=1 Tax=Promicromonospora sukumoe TaxID=88382 RepID=UPI0003794754|nr:aminoglycoside phosphotransferase family protein [Promicromonospora sukumoe]